MVYGRYEADRVRVLTQLGGALAARIEEAVPGAVVTIVPGDGELPPDVRGDVLLALPWGTANLTAVLERGVRWVHVLGTGVDRFPLPLVGERLVTCSRGASAVPIAEWTLAVMLAFEKRLPATWIQAPPASGWHSGTLGLLSGKTLGLVGVGGIGTAVAARASAFDMRVLACRRSRSAAPPPGIEVVESVLALAALADHLVIAAPATPATRHLIGAEVFGAMKPGAHLVNVARGALVDQDALRAALDDERIAMASLDAVEPEPLPADHWLYAHPRVRLSPHVSWSAPGALEELVDRFIDNLRRHLAGDSFAGVVDRAAGY
jgi:phosphoglycerate dehydrogenase-like enzyme